MRPWPTHPRWSGSAYRGDPIRLVEGRQSYVGYRKEKADDLVPRYARGPAEAISDPGSSSGGSTGGTELVVAPTLRSRLFRKYVTLFVLAVGIALLASGMVEVWSSYRDHTAWLIRIQRAQAEAAAAKIGQFIQQIEAQLGWTEQFVWLEETPEQRQADALRLLRMVTPIMELARLDPAGHEQLHVSRVDATVVGSDIDFSKEPRFVETMGNGVYYGPVYYRQGTEPYMTLAVGAGGRRDRRRDQSQIHLGRGVRNKGRRARRSLRGRCPWEADCPS